MNDPALRDRLADLVLGELSPAEREALERRLAEEPGAAELRRQLEATVNTFRVWQRGLAARPPPALPAPRARPLFLRRLPLCAAAALLALAVSLSLLPFWRRGEEGGASRPTGEWAWICAPAGQAGGQLAVFPGLAAQQPRIAWGTNILQVAAEPWGRAGEPSGQTRPTIRRVSPAELRAGLSFACALPEELPGGWRLWQALAEGPERLRLLFLREGEDSFVPGLTVCLCRSPGADGAVAAPDPGPDGRRWLAVRRRGVLVALAEPLAETLLPALLEAVLPGPGAPTGPQPEKGGNNNG